MFTTDVSCSIFTPDGVVELNYEFEQSLMDFSAGDAAVSVYTIEQFMTPQTDTTW